MSKPVTPQEMFDLWQKMVNPGAYPLQSLMFPALDVKEIEKKISELESVEHWLKANLNMLQLTIKSLDYQRTMLKGGERAAEAFNAPPSPAPPAQSPSPAAPGPDAQNPAMWGWNMMVDAMKAAQPERPPARKRRK